MLDLIDDNFWIAMKINGLLLLFFIIAVVLVILGGKRRG